LRKELLLKCVGIEIERNEGREVVLMELETVVNVKDVKDAREKKGVRLD
jgi:hypothetical protein